MNKKQCLYCGEDFKGERGLNLHFKSFAKTTHNFKFQYVLIPTHPTLKNVQYNLCNKSHNTNIG